MPDLRDRFLRALVIGGVALWAITEALSLFSAIARGPLIAAWLAVIVAATIFVVRTRTVRIPLPRVTFDPVILLCAAGIATILILTGITAALSPPNSSDAMAYHMPRVVYWAEQGSVRFFPTSYLVQDTLQPFAEYVMLHTYVISGGDHFVNFVQWFSSLACMIGVSSIAQCFGAGKRGQWIAALFCATLPSGILASSGAKNDYFMALWLVAAVYLALRLKSWRDALFLGAACGLALNTKATAYLFLPWLMIALVKKPRLVPIALVVALAINAPLFMRNYQLSGTPMGFDSAHGDGVNRWRNEPVGMGATISNMLRHTSEQLGGRSERWNRLVYRTVTKVHQILGLNPNDPATTWPYTTYRPPRNANHETDAPNRFHLFLLVVGAVVFTLSQKYRTQTRYALALLCGLIALCTWLKWQLFMARLLLPLFVLAAPLAGTLEAPVVIQLALCLLLLDSARLPTLENWVRPLKGPNSIFRSTRDSRYFADMTLWNNAPSFTGTVTQLAASKCNVIGIDLSHFELEYPLQALLRQNNPHMRYVHTGLKETNPSTRYRQPVATHPCAIVCLECAADPQRLSLYPGYPLVTMINNFVILQKTASR